METIVYQLEPTLSSAEFIGVLTRSTLAERRPVADARTVAGMLANADLVLTARTRTGLLVGISRAITDFSYCTYLSDLAIDVAYQRSGIGRELIRRTHEAAGASYRPYSAFGTQGRDLLLAYWNATPRFLLGDRPRLKPVRRKVG